jgi:inhibitor of cysteine peptidase
MSRTTKLSLILLLAILLGACSPTKSVKVLTEKDAGQSISIVKNEQFKITLDGNPTTGYNWVASGLDGAILKQVGDPEFNADSNLMGAGGKITLTFQALATGKTTLKLDYRQPWDTTTLPSKTYEVNVEVK